MLALSTKSDAHVEALITATNNARIDDTNARIDRLEGRINNRFDEVDRRFQGVDRQLEQINKRLGEIAQALAKHGIMASVPPSTMARESAKATIVKDQVVQSGIALDVHPVGSDGHGK